MHEPRPQTRSRRRTRAEQAEFYEHLVQTSLQLFFDGGYEAISMRRLASEVGIPPMSLYRYFPTKAHLIRHVWDDVLGRAHQQAARALDGAAEPHQRLRRFLDAYIGYWLENTSHYWVVFSIRDNLCDLNTEENAAAVGPNPQRFLRTLGDLVDECVPRERIAPAERQHLIDMLFCKELGFLLGTIGLGSLRWTNVAELKDRLLDDMVRQVCEAEAAVSGNGQAKSFP